MQPRETASFFLSFIFSCFALRKVSLISTFVIALGVVFCQPFFHMRILSVFQSRRSGELRNGALQIWRGVVCFSGDFTFCINILNSISTPHKHSFFIITNVLSVSRDLPHPFLTFYFNPNLHHFINNTCNLIHFLSMTIDTTFMELIGVFLNYLRFVNYNVSC